MLRKLPKRPKRETRFRSQKHLRHVRSFACCVCDSEVNIQAAHYRIGSGAGMGQKPDDWRTIPLCGGSLQVGGCHGRQHVEGEETFWREAGKDPLAIIEELIRTSPARKEIEAHRANAND